ncbi:MAG: peptidylprolyl isomerase [Bacteroidota bacterium]|jgi:peptidyl-prolyl cis-trans isomerase SurA
MEVRMKKMLFAGCLLIMFCLQAEAQSMKVVADKIVGQVGDKIILKSDIVNAIADIRRQAQGQEIQVPSECQVLEGQLIRKALVLQAQKDSLTVSEEEIEAALDNQVRMFIQSYGSKEVLEEIAGKTVYQIKEDFKEAFREKKLADQMQNKIVDGVKITPTEVKAYYSKIPTDSLPFYESEIEVSQIVVYPKANKDVEEYVSRQMYDYKRQIEMGVKKIEQLAKLFSEDPAVKENGGQYVLNRNDKNWDPAFMAASFRLKEGQVSPVVKSKFGLHIIQMISRSGDEAIVRHVLRIPPVTDDEVKEAIVKLDSVRQKLVAKQLSFGEAVSKYSDDENSKFNAGSAASNRDGSTFVNIDQLDKDLIKPISVMKPGDYSQPQVYVDERGRKAVRLIYLKNRTQPHRENLKDDYNRVAQRALEDKKNAVLEKWFKEHIPTYYVLIDREFAGCTGLDDWRLAADNASRARN